MRERAWEGGPAAGRLPGFPGLSRLGLGTTGFWSGSHDGLAACIREAVEHYGINVLDTAEMYGDGRCEEALGRVIRPMRRESLFLVDKILPQHVCEASFWSSLRGSLRRLGTDYLDLYLLHWRENADLELLVALMEEAVDLGLIRRWGVSNFDTQDLRDLLGVANGDRCFCNQIYYNIYERGCEWELLPYMQERGILPMSYSSLGSNYRPHPDIRRRQPVMRLCRETGIAPEALMLNWNAAHGICTLFSTTAPSHLRANLKEVPANVLEAFAAIIDREFPPPTHGYPLVKI